MKSLLPILLALSWVGQAHANCSSLCKNNCKAITSLCSANPMASIYGASCTPFGQICETSCDQSFCSCFNDALEQCTAGRSSCRTGKDITDLVCQVEFDVCLAITAPQCWFQWFAYGASKALPTVIAMLPQVPIISDFINVFANGFPSLSSVFKPMADVFSLPFQFLKVPAQIFKMLLDFGKMAGALFPKNLMNPLGQLGQLGQLGDFGKLFGPSNDFLNPLKGLTNLGKLMGSQSPFNFLNASKNFGDFGKSLGLPSQSEFMTALQPMQGFGLPSISDIFNPGGTDKTGKTSTLSSLEDLFKNSQRGFLQPMQEGLGLPSISDIFNPGGTDKTGKTPTLSSLSDLFKNPQQGSTDTSVEATTPPSANEFTPQQSSQNEEEFFQDLSTSPKSKYTPAKSKGFLTGIQFPTLSPASSFFNNR